MNTTPLILRDVAMNAEARTLRRPRPSATLAHAVPPLAGVEPSLTPYGRPELAAESQHYVAGELTAQLQTQPQEAAAFERGRQAGREEGVQEGIAQVQQQLEQRAQLLAQSLAEERIEQAQAHFQREANKQIEQLHAQLVPQYELLMSLLRKMPLELERRLAEAEEDIVALAFEVICRVMGDKAATPDGLTGLVKAAAKNWHGRSALEIHLHPHDLEMLQTEFNVADQLAAQRLGLDGLEMRWVADSKVSLGGCLLQSSEGALDARLELQMDLLRSSLLRTREERKRIEGLIAQEGPA